MPLYMDNYKIDTDETQSYQDFHQTCPQNTVQKSRYKKMQSELFFDLPVNYCPYLIFETNKLIKNKLKTNCYQIEFEFNCLYDNQNFTLSLSSKKGPLTLDSIFFEVEKYLRKLNLSNPIMSLEIKMIESTKRLKVISNHKDYKYNVFSSVNYKPIQQDVYLGLVKLDLETKM